MTQQNYSLIRFQEPGDTKAKVGLLVGERVLPLDGDINSLIQHWATTEGELDQLAPRPVRKPDWRCPPSRSLPRLNRRRSCRPAPTTAST